MLLQTAIRAVYPSQCIACDALTASDQGLCSNCWRETRFLGGVTCDTCGVPLPGDDPTEVVQCDECLQIARPWEHGRAALAYEGVGRKLVLGLKHGDRTDLAIPAARWMAGRLVGVARPDTLLVPVPLHWVRLAQRRYNQSALLAKALGDVLGCQLCVDGLVRKTRTKPLEGKNREERFAMLGGAILPNPKRLSVLAGRPVLLVDDVMTSGATLAACAEAARQAGAEHVSIVTLARVVKEA